MRVETDKKKNDRDENSYSVSYTCTQYSTKHIFILLSCRDGPHSQKNEDEKYEKEENPQITNYFLTTNYTLKLIYRTKTLYV